MTRRCIEVGFNVSEAKNGDGDNALHLAIQHDAPCTIMDLLLAKGPDVWDEPGDTKFQDIFWLQVENTRIQGLTTLKKLQHNQKITFNPAERKLHGNALHMVCQSNKVGKGTSWIIQTMIDILLTLCVQ